MLLSATFGVATATGGGGGGNGQVEPRREIEGKDRQLINDFEAEFSARFEQRFDRDKIRAEVSNLNLDQGTRIAVCFGGAALGDVTLNAFHFAELELDSRLGQTVPVMLAGVTVEFRTGDCSGGTLLGAATLAAGR